MGQTPGDEKHDEPSLELPSLSLPGFGRRKKSRQQDLQQSGPETGQPSTPEAETDALPEAETAALPEVHEPPALVEDRIITVGDIRRHIQPVLPQIRVPHDYYYREMYHPDARDGWYVDTGSNIHAGVAGGVSFRRYDLVLRAGQARIAGRTVRHRYLEFF